MDRGRVCARCTDGLRVSTVQGVDATAEDIEQLKKRAESLIDSLSPRLVEVSHLLHANPELNFEEHYAHELLTGEIEAAGLRPTRGAYGVATSFRADAGSQGPRVAVILEYDALPEIGHACGHNIIAAAGLGAGMVLASLADSGVGRVAIMGTPAEEGGGGKIMMARQGAFDDVDAAMMIHPADADLIRMDTIAVQNVAVEFFGKESHAAAAPHNGRNALDAAVLAYTAAGALRQHILPTERVHGVFVRGGDKPNIVPKHTEMLWYARSTTISSLQPLKERLEACFHAGAMAAGCTCAVAWEGHTYSDMRDNAAMVAAYVANSQRYGRSVADPVTLGRRVMGSTDRGNVSHLVPSIHPMIQVADPGVSIHTREFAACAASARGDQAVIDGAKAMAATVIDLWMRPGLLDAVRADFGSGPDRSVLTP
ncbi:MAG: M20 family metallopeptidase [Ilumatobacteraceae bacterium]